MLKIRIAGISLLLVLVLAISACGVQGSNPSSQTAKQETAQTAANQEKTVMDSFQALMQRADITIPEILKFIDENIAAVSPKNAAVMVIGFEKLQKDSQPKLENKFASMEEAVQKALANNYQIELTDSYINTIQSTQVKGLLAEVKNSGFKVETAEGMYFPVIDYSFYSKYRKAVTPDIAAYIDIMAVESAKTPVKDAALMISWAELLKRASNQEQFIKDYSDSPKADDMRKMLKRYASFALYGVNNTPLFSYETKQMTAEAKKAYLEVSFEANKGSFSKVMNEYLSVLKQNEYKLTDQVQQYRNKATEEIR